MRQGRVTNTTQFKETEGFKTLPSFIRSYYDRSDFDNLLSNRYLKNKVKIENLLDKHKTSTHSFQAVVGDYHFYGATSKVQINNKQYFVKYKTAKNNKIFKEIISYLNSEFSVSIKLPLNLDVDSFVLQQAINEKRLARDYSKEIGILLAFCLWFGIKDLHWENIIVSDNDIYLIDLDCFFLHEKDEYLFNGLNNSGIWYYSDLQFHKSFVKQKFIEYRIKSIIAYFLKTIETLKTQKHFYISFDKSVERRILFMDTSIYSKTLKRRYAFGWDDKKLENEWLSIRTHRPSLKKVVESEISQLKDWNIPFFTTLNDSVFSDTFICDLKSQISLIEHFERLDEISMDEYQRIITKYLNKTLLNNVYKK
ncbi:DUF4135 domain-containing protein [uncultured Tenacibaculum sp.]|uniref:DUF4135 domain-containing protein n=1 Tax=uncultured Tenacibaculum sp. TaxID=174713 RepID=UPI002607367F|nr:DUF4135 domain-containing protein [uncultured Tenacibaculum sp.]